MVAVGLNRGACLGRISNGTSGRAARGPALAAVLAALAVSGCLRRGDGAAALDARGPAAAAQPAGPRGSLTLPPHLRADAAAGATPRLAAAPATATAAAGPATTGSLQREDAARPRRPARTVRLTEAVLGAVTSYPEIKAFEARTREARAGIGVARSALLPTVETRLAAGPNFSGAYEGTTVPYDAARSSNFDGRFDAGVSLRQLLFDFGAARSDVARAELTRDAEAMKLRDKIDEIAGKTAQTYLRVLETRALVALVDDIVAAHEHLAGSSRRMRGKATAPWPTCSASPRASSTCAPSAPTSRSSRNRPRTSSSA